MLPLGNEMISPLTPPPPAFMTAVIFQKLVSSSKIPHPAEFLLQEPVLPTVSSQAGKNVQSVWKHPAPSWETHKSVTNNSF